MFSTQSYLAALFLSLGMLFMGGCGGGGGSDGGATPATSHTNVTTTGSGVATPESADLSTLSSVGTDGTLDFSAGTTFTDSLEVGQILIMGVTPQTPNGYLCKVESITTAQDGSLSVGTSAASVKDAFDELDVHTGGQLMGFADGTTALGSMSTYEDMVADIGEDPFGKYVVPAADTVQADPVVQVKPNTRVIHSAVLGDRVIAALTIDASTDLFYKLPVDPYVLYDKDGDHSSTNDQIRLEGTLYILLLPEIRIDTKTDSARIAFTGRVNGKIDIVAEAGVEATKEFDLISTPIPLGKFAVGPVIITPEFSCKIGVAGTGTVKATAGIKVFNKLDTGVTVTKGAVDSWTNTKFDAKFSEPTLEAEMSLKGYLKPKIEFKIWQFDGAYANIQPYVQLDVKPQNAKRVELTWGTDVNVGIDTKWFGSNDVMLPETKIVGLTPRALWTVGQPQFIVENMDGRIPPGSVAYGDTVTVDWHIKDYLPSVTPAPCICWGVSETDAGLVNTVVSSSVTADGLTKYTSTFTPNFLGEVYMKPQIKDLLAGTKQPTTFYPITVSGEAGTVGLSASSVSVSEGTGSVVISLERTGGAIGAVSIDYSCTDGTADSNDYTAQSGTCSWAHGESDTKTITIPLTDDGTVESAETFTISLSNLAGISSAVLGTASETVTITDNDGPGIVSLSAAQVAVDEGGTVTLSVTRTGGDVGAATVAYLASSDTAISGTDFEASSGVLSWANGESDTKTITVVVTDDDDSETSETFAITLSAPTVVSLGSPSLAVVTIAESDQEINMTGTWTAPDEDPAKPLILVLTQPKGSTNVAGTYTSESFNGTYAGSFSDDTTIAGTILLENGIGRIETPSMTVSGNGAGSTMSGAYTIYNSTGNEMDSGVLVFTKQ